MAYVATGFSRDEEEKILAQTSEIIRRQKEEESRRRWALLLGGLGAVFAAVRLGLIVFPNAKKRRTGRLGGS